MTLLWIIIGAASAVMVIWLLQRTRWATKPQTYANMLIIAAVIYVGFAIFRQELEWAYVECIGVLLFFVLALLGLKFSYWFLAVGWAAHVLWDIGLHSAEKTPFVPGWYPAACIGFDLVVAGYIALQILSLKKTKT